MGELQTLLGPAVFAPAPGGGEISASSSAWRPRAAAREVRPRAVEAQVPEAVGRQPARSHARQKGAVADAMMPKTVPSGSGSVSAGAEELSAASTGGGP